MEELIAMDKAIQCRLVKVITWCWVLIFIAIAVLSIFIGVMDGDLEDALIGAIICLVITQMPRVVCYIVKGEFWLFAPDGKGGK